MSHYPVLVAGSAHLRAEKLVAFWDVRIRKLQKYRCIVFQKIPQMLRNGEKFLELKIGYQRMLVSVAFTAMSFVMAEEKENHYNNENQPRQPLQNLTNNSSPKKSSSSQDCCFSQDYTSYQLPKCWESFHSKSSAIFLQFSPDKKSVLKQIHITSDHVEVFVGAYAVPVEFVANVKNENSFLSLIQMTEKIFPCYGNSDRCLHFTATKGKKCAVCLEKDRVANQREERHITAIKFLRKENKETNVKLTETQQKVNVLEKHNKELLVVLNNIVEKNMSSKFSDLPPNQQLVFLECFKNVATKIHGRRYSQKWIYTAILFCIKSKKGYDHVREANLLPLPCSNTIRNYLKNLDVQYGFQPMVFELMKEKGKDLLPLYKRGSLLLDEMKLTENLSFNKETLTVAGFVQLGENFTSEKDSTTPGDHALVLMYQPFAGDWIQVIAAFLTKNAAKGDVLHGLVIEATALLENAGFAVDCIVTDGASWNRRMWKLFRINESRVSCAHPMDENRELFFASDFPHLIKNIRNYITSKPSIQTPSGEISVANWNTVLAHSESTGKYGLRACPKLTKNHMSPQTYDKMSVNMAYQFFGEDVFGLMETIADKDEDLLINGKGCVEFVKKIHLLIRAMSSRTPENALTDKSPEKKIIEDFIQYVQEWRTLASNHRKQIIAQNKLLKKRKRDKAKIDDEVDVLSNLMFNIDTIDDIQITDDDFNELDENEEELMSVDGKFFLSNSTMIGLLVTCLTALQLHQYLARYFGFKYLQLCRINQDNLERFFSMMRYACGCNDQPNSLMFIRVFKLLLTYSLVKPRKGSNVDKSQDLMMTLVQSKDMKLCQKRNAQEKWKFIADCILTNCAEIDDVEMEIHYTNDTIYENMVQWMGGYVLQKLPRFVNCKACETSLTGETACPFIQARDLFNQLKKPSPRLSTLLDKIEEIIVSTLDKDKLHSETFFEIMYLIEDRTVLPKVGCNVHCDILTKRIIYFYVSVRMHFICKVINDENSKLAKIRELKKQAKLC